MTNSEKYQEGWEKIYSVQNNPFDIEEPLEWVVELENSGKIKGAVFDVGCGAGHNSIFLAKKGYKVFGTDLILKGAIDRAIKKAQLNHVNATFFSGNICELKGYDNTFDIIIDIGCFHSLDKEDYHLYADALFRSCKQHATIHMRAFSDKNLEKSSEYTGPVVSEKDINETFSYNWSIKNLIHKEIEIKLSDTEKPKLYVWFAEIDVIK